MSVKLGGKAPKKRSSQKLKQNFPMGLDDTFKFGKYKDTDTQLWSVIRFDTEYIDYCIESVDDFELDNEAFEIYRQSGGKH